MKSLLVLLITMSVNASADQYVNGYYKSNGTYVQPHYRSTADSNPYNNYSYQGNTNPYTGQQGTKSYDQSYPSYNYQNNSYGKRRGY